MTAYFLTATPFVFILGACIGSFLTVCISRIPDSRSIVFPGSLCPFCHTKIPFYYNIPILSYILLKGRCRFCSHSIPVRYPLVESLTAVLAVLVVHQFGVTPEMLFWFVFICVLIIVSFIDMAVQIIPDIISLPGIVLFASAFYFVPEMTVKDTIFGILAGGGSLYLVALFYYVLKKQDGMGGGDIKLLAMIGAATGIKGVVFTIFAGSLLGTFFGVIFKIYTQKADTKLKIPFGPFLSAGAVLYIFSGTRLIDWYMDLSTGS